MARRRVHAQPLSGIPFTVHVAAPGSHHVGLTRFTVASADARGARIQASGLVMAGVAACARRWRRLYAAYLLALAGCLPVACRRCWPRGHRDAVIADAQAEFTG